MTLTDANLKKLEQEESKKELTEEAPVQKVLPDDSNPEATPDLIDLNQI